VRKTYGFAFETGPAVLFPGTTNIDERTSFHPDDPTLIKRDIKAGIISLLQQSICAIEFIGITLSGRTRGLERMRAVRDQQLATTAAGRQLITLFERVQIPLLGLILADKSLTKEAMSLLETSIKLLESEKSVLSAREVERGLAFVEGLAARTKSKSLRRDLNTVSEQLKSSSNKTVSKILKQLLNPTASKRSKR
jgi:hypothetical protein